MTTQALASNLLGTAVCQTDHPTAAVSALLMAAGELLHARFGPADAVGLLRTIVDETEAAMIARHGRQTGEAVQ